ncbi:MAG: glutamyl-tRNA reductase [Actinobacteria bacterium]|nr:glutamyl-tRNA reductase [Actinomycetota bacterium]
MPVVLVGLNYKTAPLDLLERLFIPQERLPKALGHLATLDHVIEGVVISTCNRVEVYGAVTKFHGGVQDLRNFLAEFCHVAVEDFADHLYTYHDEAAVRHLLRVATGIDSMVVGESEILGQIRRSFSAAEQEGSAQRILGAAFRQALRAGKRARTETSIARHPVSVPSAAAELARRRFGTLTGKNVVVVGAGAMGRLAARSLMRHGVTDVTVVNRTESRGSRLASDLGAAFRSFNTLGDALAKADIVVSSTTAPSAVIDRALVHTAMTNRRRERPLFIVDIGMPRDVEPDVAREPGVVLQTISDLKDVAEAGRETRLDQIPEVDAIIDQELRRFVEWERSAHVAPTASALVTAGEAIRAAEIERLAKGPARLTPDQVAAVDLATQRITAKLLHTPLKRARELAGSKQGYIYLSAIRELFELDDEL